MATTTIRVPIPVQQGLKAIAQEDGRTIQDVAEEALKLLRRTRRAERARMQLERLRGDPEAWADYLAGAEATHVTDGVIAPDAT